MSWLHWALLSAAFAGMTAVLAKVGVRDVNSDLATALRTSFILPLVWGISLVRNPQPLSAISRTAWVFLGLSALATGASWLCYFRALQLGQASRVAPIDKLSIVLVMIFAVCFLGERLTWKVGIGAVLVSTGAALMAI